MTTKRRLLHTLPKQAITGKMSDRDSNVQSMTDTLLREGAIESVRPVEQYTKLVCDVNRTTCMYGECTHCEDRRLDIVAMADDTIDVVYMQRTTQEYNES